MRDRPRVACEAKRLNQRGQVGLFLLTKQVTFQIVQNKSKTLNQVLLLGSNTPTKMLVAGRSILALKTRAEDEEEPW